MDKQQFFNWIANKGFNLTENQKAAVAHVKGPMLLLAVPGAGKTTVLTIRLLYLVLVERVDPKRILCLTFGNAAAKEMKERFHTNFAANINGNIHFSTIHSFAYQIFRTDFAAKGKSFDLIENQVGANSKTGVLRSIYQRLNNINPTDDQLEELQNMICLTKNTMQTPAEPKESSIKNFVRAYEAYEDYKEKHNPRLIDFDDMLSLAYSTLRTNSELLSRYRQHYDYILTDESQDTSLLQHRIIELVAKPKTNIFVVGDDDQSIFGFRAAEPKYLLDFENTYAGAKVLRMEQNFRSTPEIVNIAREFIRSNEMRYDKNMFTQKPSGDLIKIGQFDGAKEQNQFILQELSKEQNLKKVAVLFRNNISAISLIDELDRRKLLFYMREANKDRFFTHWAVSDIVNFLNFSLNNRDLDTFEQIYTKCNFYTKKQVVLSLKGKPSDGSVFDILTKLPETTEKQAKQYQRLQRSFDRIKGLTPYAAIRDIRLELGYDYAVERICRALGFSEDNVRGLLAILESIALKESTVPGFLNRLSYLKDLMESSFKNKGANAVTLSTIHSSKGLEWDKVYMIDLIEGIIPENNSAESGQEGLEEERRLFYVGMTRAKKQLTLCGLNYYQSRLATDSRFVTEVSYLLMGKSAAEASTSGKSLVPGTTILHKDFGNGKVVKVERDLVRICFKDGTERSFLKEMCEDGNLLKIHAT
jgi:DNA helicase II / ATP-dependent DNA helicase PcrA